MTSGGILILGRQIGHQMRRDRMALWPVAGHVTADAVGHGQGAGRFARNPLGPNLPAKPARTPQNRARLDAAQVREKFNLFDELFHEAISRTSVRYPSMDICPLVYPALADGPSCFGPASLSPHVGQLSTFYVDSGYLSCQSLPPSQPDGGYHAPADPHPEDRRS